MMQPLVTIIIPTFNQDVYILQAIESALSQTYKNLEVVVGDDASIDKTSEIVERVHDPRLKYIKNPLNLGRVGNYRNLLYKHASGDFVVNLDGDDYYTDCNFIFNAIRLMRGERNVVMICARAVTKSKNAELISDIPDEVITSGVNILKKLPDRRYFFMHMAVLYSRIEAVKIDFYRSEVVSSDWESLYRLSLRGDVKYLDACVGVWRIHGYNETETSTAEKKIENLGIWPVIYAEAKKFGMNLLLAEFKSAKCIAYSSQIIFIKESLVNNRALFRAMASVFLKYKVSALITFFHPSYFFRLMLCLSGYYRYRHFK